VYSCALSVDGVTLTGLSQGSIIVMINGSVKVTTFVVYKV